jgi:hypothetical protein
MTELEKRFDLSPEGGRLNVSAGLAGLVVPLMSDCNKAKNRVTTDTIQTLAQLQFSLKTFLPMESGA